MKFLLIILTICLMIFMPKRDVRVEVVEAQEVSEPQKIAEPTPTKMPKIEELPSKRINAYSQEVEGLIRAIFGEDAEIALALSYCESGLRPDAIGDHAISYVENGIEYGKSYGLFQIRYLPGRPKPEQLLNPDFNVKFAKKMYDAQGGSPWSVFNGPCYKSKLSSL